MSIAQSHETEHLGDNVVALREVTWADYQRILEIRGERSAPRISYLEGTIEIMSPGKRHEAIKSLIGRLVETWCVEKGIEVGAYGAWSLESKASEAGVEPDECYVFGEEQDVERPHLAIEVVWSSGGTRKLEIYRRLGVREVWFWRKGKLQAFVLEDGAYVERDSSAVLPGIDLAVLAGFLGEKTITAAMRGYRAAIRSRE